MIVVFSMKKTPHLIMCKNFSQIPYNRQPIKTQRAPIVSEKSLNLRVLTILLLESNILTKKAIRCPIGLLSLKMSRSPRDLLILVGKIRFVPMTWMNQKVIPWTVQTKLA